MSEIERMVDQLKRAQEGPAWHGPSIKESLSGVNATMAARKPIAGAHSIWEIVLHIAAWERAVTTRVKEGKRVELTETEDWPTVESQDEAAWRELLSSLEKVHRSLRVSIGSLSDESIDQMLEGDRWAVYQTIHGVIQHDLYHAGQISLLKRALQ